MVNSWKKTVNSNWYPIFSEETAWVSWEIKQAFSNKTQLIDKIQDDPTFLPTYKEVVDIIRDPKRLIYDLNILTDIYPNENEIITKEIIYKIADIAQMAISNLSKLHENIMILEVGAGKWRLSFALNNELKKRWCDRYKIIATDIEPKEAMLLPIEKMSYDEAIDKYQPHIILNSRMPQIWSMLEWRDTTPEGIKERMRTHKFCENENTQLYILFWEPGIAWDPRYVRGQEILDCMSDTEINIAFIKKRLRRDKYFWNGEVLNKELLDKECERIFHLIPYISKWFKRYPNITSGRNIHNPIASAGPRNATQNFFRTDNTISKDNWEENIHGYYPKRSMTSIFIKNHELTEELKKKKLL